MDYIEISAKTIEEAVTKGTAQLKEDGKVVADTKVLEQPSSGFLGIGRRDALVRLYFEEAPVTEKIAQAIDETVAVVEEKVESAVEEVKVAVNEAEAKVVEVVESTVTAADEVATEVVAAVKPQREAISKEEQIRIADKGKQFLQDMFAKMGLTVQIEKMMTADKITFQIHGEELGILIGKHGQTLDAIQYLTNLVANKEVAGHCHIVVDVENYRARREKTLMNLAKRLASKVKRNRQKISLEPMSAFERKIIHLTLQNEPHIVTDSEGEEPYRHVVIAYKR